MPVGGRGEPSRAATDRLLGELHVGRWRPRAWRGFLIGAAARSVGQAAAHPRALAEASLLHGLFALVANRATNTPTRWRWIATSWVLTALHLGMLESAPSLGAANALTLGHANLPVAGAGLGRWIGVVALTTDFVDGKLARRTSTTTAFGTYADPFADMVFWIWLVFRDGNAPRGSRAAVALTWLAPAATVTTQSFRRGRMLEPPRPRKFRPAVALQILLAAHCLRRRHLSAAPHESPLSRRFR